MGDVEGCLVRKFVMDPGWEIWMYCWLENFDWTLAGGSGRNFGWKVETDLGWENQKDFWLENVKIECSVKLMEM